jgi:SAM-dependent methyltransferase
MLSAREANRRYFHQAYRTGEHGWSVDMPSPCVVEALKRLKNQVSGGTLLDIGCGEGRHSIAAARLGFRVTGVDYEPLALKRARRFAVAKSAAGIRFRKGDVFSLPFRDASFDIVIDCGCLHHQRKRDWAAYRANLLRVLRPGGFHLLSVFSPRFRLFSRSRRQWQIAFGAYRRYFRRRDILDLFSRHFDILDIQEDRAGGFWNLTMQRRPRAETQ